MAETLQENNYRIGLNTAREQARRDNAVGQSADQDEDGGLEEQEAKSQNFLRRRLDMLKNRSKDQGGESADIVQKQAEEKLKKELARKASLKAANLAMGATLILLVVTVLVWTVQFIGGNLLGSKVIPKLDLGEIILWLIAMAVVATLFFLIMFFIAMISYAYQHPLEALINMGSFFRSVFWEVFKSLFKN